MGESRSVSSALDEAMSQNAQFWLGILFSIPIGIGTSLATPQVQRWLESQSKHRAFLQNRRIEAEYSEARFYYLHANVFTQYLVHVAIKTALLSGLMAVGSGSLIFLGQVVFAVSHEIRLEPMVGEALLAAGQAVTLVGSIAIVNLCKPALNLWRRIRNFDDYAAQVPLDVRTKIDLTDTQS